MAKRTAKPQAKKLATYMKKMSKDGSTTAAVSARVDTGLRDRFNGAVKLAQQHDVEVSISEVIRDAMERACIDVERYTGKTIGQMDLPMEDPKKASPKV